MSGISNGMLLANFCLAWTAFPPPTHKVKTRLSGWSPLLSYRFYRMLEFGASRNLLSAAVASMSGSSGGAQITPRNISDNIRKRQNVLQNMSVPQNLSFVTQTTDGIADSAYSLLQLAVAKKFELMDWVLNIRTAVDATIAVNNFRKSMKNNADLALDSYEDMLILAHRV